MNYQTAHHQAISLAGAKLSYPYGRHLAVYSLKGQMFALMDDQKQPLRISLRCDHHLAELLKERYEEVMTAQKLDKDKWLSVVASGQLKDPEIIDLIRHSYEIVSDEL